MNFTKLFWKIHYSIRWSFFLRFFFRKLWSDFEQLLAHYCALEVIHTEYVQGTSKALCQYHDVVESDNKKYEQLQKLKAECRTVLELIEDVGNKQDWENAAETQRTYTWAEFQYLNELLEEIQ